MNDRITYLSTPVTLTGLVAPGERRVFVGRGTGYSVWLAREVWGLMVYVTGPNGVAKEFESFKGDSADQTAAWEHATKLLARVFGTIGAETADEEQSDDFLTVTAAASIAAHRERKAAKVTPVEPVTEAAREGHAFDPYARRGWASRGGRTKMTPAQRRALQSGLATGTVERGVEASISTLRTLVKNGWAEPVEDSTWHGRPTLVAAALTKSGRLALAEATARLNTTPAQRFARMLAVTA
jgi:hypothetical protein